MAWLISGIAHRQCVTCNRNHHWFGHAAEYKHSRTPNARLWRDGAARFHSDAPTDAKIVATGIWPNPA